MLIRLTTMLAVLTLCSSAWAQDDPDERDGSRPAVRVDEDDARPSADVTLGYRVDLLAGAYAESSDLGGLAAAELALEAERNVHRVSLDVGFEHDPFARRTFNFADEDTDASPQRLAQRVDTVSGSLRWRSEVGDGTLDLRLAGAHAFTELESDARTSLDLDGMLRFGASFVEQGPWVEPRAELLARRYPEYRVADRDLDQIGAGTGVEAGYSAGRPLDIALSWDIRGTAYIDARYDAVDAQGTIIRDDTSKSYLVNDVTLAAVGRPTRGIRASIEASWRRHDSRHYDRVIDANGADGSTDARLVRDYYDYDRIGVDASVSWRPIASLRLGVGASWWRRAFDTYEARDADNRWTGALRVDHHAGADADVAWRLAQRAHWELSALAEASWLSRSSNMLRERSFATNYDMTRVFVGLSLEGVAVTR